MPGPHGFTVRSSSDRLARHNSLTRFISPCDCHCAPDALASTASRPASVTIAIRPCGGQDGWDMQLIWVKREGGNFLKEGWTTQITLIAKEIFPFSSFRGARSANPESGLSCAKKRIPE